MRRSVVLIWCCLLALSEMRDRLVFFSFAEPLRKYRWFVYSPLRQSTKCCVWGCKSDEFLPVTCSGVIFWSAAFTLLCLGSLLVDID